MRVDWIHLAEDRQKWRSLVTKVVNLWAADREFIN